MDTYQSGEKYSLSLSELYGSEAKLFGDTNFVFSFSLNLGTYFIGSVILFCF